MFRRQVLRQYPFLWIKWHLTLNNRFWGGLISLSHGATARFWFFFATMVSIRRKTNECQEKSKSRTFLLTTTTSTTATSTTMTTPLTTTTTMSTTTTTTPLTTTTTMSTKWQQQRDVDNNINSKRKRKEKLCKTMTRLILVEPLTWSTRSSFIVVWCEEIETVGQFLVDENRSQNVSSDDQRTLTSGPTFSREFFFQHFRFFCFWV